MSGEGSTDGRSTLALANAAIVAGDYDGFLDQCTDDTEWVFVGERTLRGKEAVRRWMADTYREPPRLVVDRMIAISDTVVAIGEVTTVDQHGDETTSAYCDVWTPRNGKLAGISDDTLTVTVSNADSGRRRRGGPRGSISWSARPARSGDVPLSSPGASSRTCVG